MILHILGRDEWAVALATGVHRTPSLEDQGFIHCSDPGTVHLPAARLFAGRTDLLLLVIDPDRLPVPVRWEPGDPADQDGPWFPHVYGPIPVAAVVATHDFPPHPGGGFRLPPELVSTDGK